MIIIIIVSIIGLIIFSVFAVTVIILLSNNLKDKSKHKAKTQTEIDRDYYDSFTEDEKDKIHKKWNKFYNHRESKALHLFANEINADPKNVSIREDSSGTISYRYFLDETYNRMKQLEDRKNAIQKYITKYNGSHYSLEIDKNSTIVKLVKEN